MKIAIQGHPTRGEEVIKTLENLGATSYGEYDTCSHPEWYWYIGKNKEITCDHKRHMCGYKRYTLEEFEKDFPFKIGDKVIHSYSPNFIGTVVNIKFDDCIPYRVNIEGKIYTCETMSLKLYTEMKEERNITLTIDKAKEWYKKGGELKEIALQAFSEKELNPLPRSWEEFVESTKFTFNCSLEYINGIGRWSNGCLPNKSIGESSEIWNKHVALFQLEQLRNYWIQNRTYKWDDHSFKYQIKFMYNRYEVLAFKCVRNFLTFPTREMAKEFLKCFRDLIKKAGDLI